MKTKRKLVLAALFAGTALLAGCSGGSAKVQQNLSSVSQGQQLEDLKKALEQGAITQEEYNKLQKKVLQRGY